jgi:hypothetical protein
MDAGQTLRVCLGGENPAEGRRRAAQVLTLDRSEGTAARLPLATKRPGLPLLIFLLKALCSAPFLFKCVLFPVEKNKTHAHEIETLLVLLPVGMRSYSGIPASR